MHKIFLQIIACVAHIMIPASVPQFVKAMDDEPRWVTRAVYAIDEHLILSRTGYYPPYSGYGHYKLHNHSQTHDECEKTYPKWNISPIGDTAAFEFYFPNVKPSKYELLMLANCAACRTAWEDLSEHWANSYKLNNRDHIDPPQVPIGTSVLQLKDYDDWDYEPSKKTKLQKFFHAVEQVVDGVVYVVKKVGQFCNWVGRGVKAAWNFITSPC